MSEAETRAHRSGRDLGRLLGEFRAAKPQHSRLSDDQIIEATGDLDGADALVRSIVRGDEVEAGSARGELFDAVDSKLKEKHGGASFGDILDAGQKKTGLW